MIFILLGKQLIIAQKIRNNTRKFSYLWHSISPADFSVQLVQIKRYIIGIISHWNPQAWGSILLHEVLESIEELLSLRFVSQLILFCVREMAAGTGRVLDVILRQLRCGKLGSRELGCR